MFIMLGSGLIPTSSSVLEMKAGVSLHAAQELLPLGYSPIHSWLLRCVLVGLGIILLNINPLL